MIILKIEEVNEYFVSKLLAGDFLLNSRSLYQCFVSIVDEDGNIFCFWFWHRNGYRDLLNSHQKSFMAIWLTSEQLKTLYDLLLTKSIS